MSDPRKKKKARKEGGIFRPAAPLPAAKLRADLVLFAKNEMPARLYREDEEERRAKDAARVQVRSELGSLSFDGTDPDSSWHIDDLLEDDPSTRPIIPLLPSSVLKELKEEKNDIEPFSAKVTEILDLLKEDHPCEGGDFKIPPTYTIGGESFTIPPSVKAFWVDKSKSEEFDLPFEDSEGNRYVPYDLYVVDQDVQRFANRYYSEVLSIACACEEGEPPNPNRANDFFLPEEPEMVTRPLQGLDLTPIRPLRPLRTGLVKQKEKQDERKISNPSIMVKKRNSPGNDKSTTRISILEPARPRAATRLLFCRSRSSVIGQNSINSAVQRVKADGVPCQIGSLLLVPVFESQESNTRVIGKIVNIGLSCTVGTGEVTAVANPVGDELDFLSYASIVNSIRAEVRRLSGVDLPSEQTRELVSQLVTYRNFSCLYGDMTFLARWGVDMAALSIR